MTPEEFWRENKNKNFPFEIWGKTVWISRSIAVAGFVFYESDGNTYVLANKRGDGTPNYQHFWNAPCGYLDYNETTEEAISREVFEETSLRVPPKEFHFLCLNSDPNEGPRQNVTLRYGVILPKEKAISAKFSTRNSEEDEVEDIKWINLKDLDKYQWAFNHRKLIPEMYNKIKYGV